MALTQRPPELWVPPNPQPWEDEVSQPQYEKPPTYLEGSGKHTGPADPAEPQETHGLVFVFINLKAMLKQRILLKKVHLVTRNITGGTLRRSKKRVR